MVDSLRGSTPRICEYCVPICDPKPSSRLERCDQIATVHYQGKCDCGCVSMEGHWCRKHSPEGLRELAKDQVYRHDL